MTELIRTAEELPEFGEELHDQTRITLALPKNAVLLEIENITINWQISLMNLELEELGGKLASIVCWGSFLETG